MGKTKGRLTLPSESNFLEQTKELLDRWGADAIRDSDGTKLDEATKQLDAKIYTTYSCSTVNSIRFHQRSYGRVPTNLRHVKILVSNRRYANDSIYGRLLRRPSATRLCT